MIIERYLLKDILSTLGAVALVLTVIYLGNRFIIFLTNAAMSGVQLHVILTLLLLKTIGAMVVVLPMALYLSVLFVFGRLYKDSEMTALTACGVSMGRIVRVVLVLSLLVAAGVAFISLYLKPWAEEQSYDIQDQLEAGSQIRGITAGRFNESARGDGVFYVEELSPGMKDMRNVFVQYQRKGEPVVMAARSAYQKVDKVTGGQYLVLVDGRRYEGKPGTAKFRIVQFKEHAILIRPQPVQPAQRDIWALPTRQLWSEGRAPDIAELQWRVSMPVSAVVLAMLAVSLSRTTPRQGRFGKLFNAILAYIIYSNLLAVAKTWLAHGEIPQWLGLWWVHLLFISAVLVLFARHYGIGLLARVVPARVPSS